jgi:hypothetical protein
MCRNIKTLFNFEPPATEAEIHASALQFVRKLSGFSKPSQANAEAFDRAVEEVSAAARRLLTSLHTHAPARDRAIEAEKARWPTISWAVEPGDVIFFHFKTLHGGAATRPGQRRRTLTLRFFGERTHYDPKTAKALPNMPDMAEVLKPGQTMRGPGFLQLYPKVTVPAAP